MKEEGGWEGSRNEGSGRKKGSTPPKIEYMRFSINHWGQKCNSQILKKKNSDKFPA